MVERSGFPLERAVTWPIFVEKGDLTRWAQKQGMGTPSMPWRTSFLEIPQPMNLTCNYEPLALNLGKGNVCTFLPDVSELWREDKVLCSEHLKMILGMAIFYADPTAWGTFRYRLQPAGPPWVNNPRADCFLAQSLEAALGPQRFEALPAPAAHVLVEGVLSV